MTKFSLRDDNKVLFILFVEYFVFIGRDCFFVLRNIWNLQKLPFTEKKAETLSDGWTYEWMADNDLFSTEFCNHYKGKVYSITELEYTKNQ